MTPTLAAVMMAAVVVIALELGILVSVVLFVALRAARAWQAVETVAYRVDEQVDRFGEAFRSRWFKTTGLAASVLSGFFSGRGK